MQRVNAWALAIALLAPAAAGCLERGQASDSFEIPRLEGGWRAMYEGHGTLQNAGRLVYTGREQGGGTPMVIDGAFGVATRVGVGLTAYGNAAEMLVLVVHDEAGVMHGGAADDQGVVATGEADAVAREGVGELAAANIHYNPSETGPLDLMALSGRAWSAVAQPLRPDEAARTKPIQVLAGPGEARGTIRVDLEQGGTKVASFLWDDECPLPESLAYSFPGRPAFAAKRTSCAHDGSATGPLEPEASEAAPETVPLGRAFPGQGADFPLPYRPALAAFLNLSRVAAFRGDHPGWVLECAILAPPATSSGTQDALLARWNWYFEVVGGSWSQDAVVTRVEDAVGAGALFIEDPRGQSHNGCVVGPPAARASRTVSMDSWMGLFERFAPPERWSGQGEFGGVRVEGRDLASVGLDHCPPNESICLLTGRSVSFDLAGQAAFITMPPEWLDPRVAIVVTVGP